VTRCTAFCRTGVLRFSRADDVLLRRTELEMSDTATVVVLDRTGCADDVPLSDISADRAILALAVMLHVDVYCVQIPPLLRYVKMNGF